MSVFYLFLSSMACLSYNFYNCWCQFHQQIMRAFCANIFVAIFLRQKITKPNVTRGKPLNSLLYKNVQVKC